MVAGSDWRWIARGIGAGAGAMIAAVLVAVAIATAVIGDAGTEWGDRRTLAAVVFTALWCLAAGVAAAVGTWQAAEGGAPNEASARLAGAIGPVACIVLVSLTALGGDGASGPTIAAEGIVEIAAAMVGAQALARRLETGW
jgi:hypothetical protein